MHDVAGRSDGKGARKQTLAVPMHVGGQTNMVINQPVLLRAPTWAPLVCYGVLECYNL
jgi:hypothetical protein